MDTRSHLGASGGAYEPRTVIAMTGRTIVWLAISAIAYR
jgi:hypothetical protein